MLDLMDLNYILYSIVVQDQRVYHHYLDPRLTLTQGDISKVKATLHTYPKSVSGYNFPCHVGSELYFAQLLSMTQEYMYAMTLTQGRISKVKATVPSYSKSESGPSLLTTILDLDIISHKYCPWPNGISWAWLNVIFPRSRSHCTHFNNPCPCHNSLLSCWIWIIFHAMFVHDRRVCRDLDPRSMIHYIIVVHDPVLCHFPGLKFSRLLVNWIWMILTTVIVHGPGAVVAGGGYLSRQDIYS